MLSARIELRGEELFCADTGDGGISTIRRLTPETLARLKGWAEHYDTAVKSGALPPLVDIGQDMAAFLDEGDRWLDQVLGGTIGEIALDIAVPGQPEERERILLDIPWELLTRNGQFLAKDDERLFRVTRRLGGSGTPATPEFRDLSLLFMAAEVEGQGVLNYEQEEAGILQATNGLPLNLNVEESGAIEFLGQRIAQEGPFEALHLSCHGDIVKGHPVLALEKPEGGLDLVGIVPLSRALARKTGSRNWFSCRPAAPGSTAPRRLLFNPSSARELPTRSAGMDRSMTPTRSALPRRFIKNWRGEARSPMPRRAPAAHCCAPIWLIQTKAGIGIWREPIPARAAAARSAPLRARAASFAAMRATRNFSTSGKDVCRSPPRPSSSAGAAKRSAFCAPFVIGSARVF